jgi:cytochrome c55X
VWRAAIVQVITAGILAALSEPAVAASEPSGARQAQLLELLKHDCGSCHGLTMRGGLGPPLLPQALATIDDAVLIETILDGRPGTPMPPWRFQLDPADAAWLVKSLRAGVSP